MLRILCFLLFFGISFIVNAGAFTGDSIVKQFPDTLCAPSPENIYLISDSVPGGPIDKDYRQKKTIAAVLAFPLPFGILGLHRIFLGTKPYMPFAYIGTLGGCVGLLPLIDFIAILSSNREEFKKYENNPKVFMWSH